jgi:hypothetical protein
LSSQNNQGPSGVSTYISQEPYEQELKLTSAFVTFRFALQTALVYQIQRLDRVPGFNNTGDVDLARALAYHLNIDVSLCERREHSSCYTNHIAHLSSDQR